MLSSLRYENMKKKTLKLAITFICVTDKIAVCNGLKFLKTLLTGRKNELTARQITIEHTFVCFLVLFRATTIQ